jgi:hypothetical protein
MTLRDISFLAAVFCASGVMGVLLGVLCHGRARLAIALSVVISLLFFVALEWRFGSPVEWPWQSPITNSAYLFGPFLLLIGVPTVGAAVFAGRWARRR